MEAIRAFINSPTETIIPTCIKESGWKTRSFAFGLILTGCALYTLHKIQKSQASKRLGQAFWDGDLPTIKEIFGNNPILTKDKKREYLHFAIFGAINRTEEERAQHLETVKYLVEDLGADVNGYRASSGTPLITALTVEDLPIANYLLDQGADAGIPHGQYSALYIATLTKICDCPIVQRILENAPAPVDNTHNPLAAIAKTDKYDVAGLLLKNGYSPFAPSPPNDKGFQVPDFPVVVAAESENLKMLELLLANREEDDFSIDVFKETAKAAIIKNCTEILEWLFDEYPSLFYKIKDALLHTAIFKESNDDIIEFLLCREAVADKDALFFLWESNSLERFQKCLEQIKDNQLQNVLHKLLVHAIWQFITRRNGGEAITSGVAQEREHDPIMSLIRHLLSEYSVNPKEVEISEDNPPFMKDFISRSLNNLSPCKGANG